MKPSAEDYEKAIDIVRARMEGDDVVVQEVVKVANELAAARESAAAVPVAELKASVTKWRYAAWKAGQDAPAQPIAEKKKVVCANCDGVMPVGCNGVLSDDGEKCALNGGPTYAGPPAYPIAEKAEPDHRASPLDVDLSWLRKAVYSYPPVEAQHALHRVEQRLTAQEPQAGQWRPIETAPKDGTPILLAGDGKVERAIWDYARPWIDGWWCEGHRSDAVGPDFVPTHWMPLPQPPQSEKAQAKP